MRVASREEARLEASHRNLERAIGFIEHADTKALIVLAFQGALIAHLGAFADALRQTIESQRWIWTPTVILVLLGLGLGAPVYSVLYASVVLSARILKSEDEPGREEHLSTFFFGKVNRMTLKTFREEGRRRDPP